MKQIILIRHSESDKTVSDSHLTEKGNKQAEKVEEFLKKYEYEAIFTSLYSRAQETAKIINTKKLPLSSTSAFNEYYVRPDGTDVESISQAQERAMGKLYSVFGQYESVVIVFHSSIGKTILQSLLNLKYDDAKKYFNEFGETQVLRYDYKKGDTCWKIIDSYIPKNND